VITTRSVILVLRIEASLLALALALLIGHGAHHAWRARRLGPRLASARRSLTEALAADAPELTTGALRARLPVEQMVVVLGELAPNLTGGHRRLLTRAAGDAGLLTRAGGLCRSRSWRRRLRGARLFTLLGGGTASVPRLLDDPRAEVRAQAAEWAGGHPAEHETVARLVALLDDDDVLCRFAVDDSLLRLGSPAIAPLVEHLRRARGDAARRAMRIATSLADARLYEPALEHCRDPEPGARAAAAALIGALGGARGTGVLQALLADPAAPVRAAAAAALGRLRHWPAAPSLAVLLADEAWDVRRAAALALRELGGAGTLVLQRSLSHPDAFARDMARHVLDLPANAERTAACRFL
jgi:hypothetical protein